MSGYSNSWRYFNLMDEAVSRLEGGTTLQGVHYSYDRGDSLTGSRSKRKRTTMEVTSPTGSVEIEVSVNGDDEEVVQEGTEDLNRIMQDVEDERSVMDSERRCIEREKQLIERERLVLQRERAVLDREAATLERDRASLEREKVMFEKEKEAMEEEKATIEKDRDAVNKDRLVLDQERARLERRVTEKDVKDLTGMSRRERFLYLFEKLIEDF